jgi:hypothetical protein
MQTDTLMSLDGATSIVQEMHNNYGEKFVKQWASIDRDDLINTARRVLAGLTRSEVQRGLETMYTKTFCPSLPEFRAMCRTSSRLDISWDCPDTAWAKALESLDENKTIVWTNEATEAMAIAQIALDNNDKFTAGRAFKEQYTRLVDKAKLEQRMPKYWTSFGDDKNHRIVVIENAQSKGMIDYTPEQAHEAIGYIKAEAKPIPDVLGHLAKLKEMMGVSVSTIAEKQAQELAKIESKKQAQLAILSARKERHIDPFDDNDEYLDMCYADSAMQINLSRASV